jgi:hypothetical protein
MMMVLSGRDGDGDGDGREMKLLVRRIVRKNQKVGRTNVTKVGNVNENWPSERKFVEDWQIWFRVPLARNGVDRGGATWPTLFQPSVAGVPFQTRPWRGTGLPHFWAGQGTKTKVHSATCCQSRPPFGMTMAAIHDKVAQQGRGDHRELTATGRRTNGR